MARKPVESKPPAESYLIRLLRGFGDSWSLEVGAASNAAFEEVMFCNVSQLMKDSVRDGLVEPADDNTEPVKDCKDLYFRCFRLTDKGREKIGLGPWSSIEPEVKEIKKPKAKSAQGELF